MAVVLVKESKEDKSKPVHEDLGLPEHHGEQGDVCGRHPLDAGRLAERGRTDL